MINSSVLEGHLWTPEKHLLHKYLLNGYYTWYYGCKISARQGGILVLMELTLFKWKYKIT